MRGEPNPFEVTTDPPASVVRAAFIRNGDPDKEEECRGDSYSDEFFVLSSAVPTLPNGREAARLSVKTAVWGYRNIRQKHFYWNDKQKLIFRIFKSTNIRLWQKTRDSGFEDGLATSMVLAIISVRNVWIGSIGDCRGYVIRDGRIFRRTEPDTDHTGALTDMVGLKRYGTIPRQFSLKMDDGDVILLVNHQTAKLLDEEILAGLTKKHTDPKALAEAVMHSTDHTGSNGVRGVFVIIKSPNPDITGLQSATIKL